MDLLRQLDGLEHGCCEKREELFEVIARDRYAELFGPTVGDKVRAVSWSDWVKTVESCLNFNT